MVYCYWCIIRPTFTVSRPASAIELSAYIGLCSLLTHYCMTYFNICYKIWNLVPFKKDAMHKWVKGLEAKGPLACKPLTELGLWIKAYLNFNLYIIKRLLGLRWSISMQCYYHKLQAATLLNTATAKTSSHVAMAMTSSWCWVPATVEWRSVGAWRESRDLSRCYKIHDTWDVQLTFLISSADVALVERNVHFVYLNKTLTT